MNKRLGISGIVLILLVVGLSGCFEGEQKNGGEKDTLSDVPFGDMTISSSAFKNGETIPSKYRADISPPLNFTNIPENADSLVLIMDDPDASGGTWVHWLVWNIPPSATGFSEGEDIIYQQGKNSWGETEYRGPSLPSGTHRYFFRLYALNITLDLKEGATRQQLEEAMSGHTIEKAELMGKYSSS